jgi:hypothetical protein
VRLVLFNIGLHEVGGWAFRGLRSIKGKRSSKSIYVAEIQEIYFRKLRLHKLPQNRIRGDGEAEKRLVEA